MLGGDVDCVWSVDTQAERSRVCVTIQEIRHRVNMRRTIFSLQKVFGVNLKKKIDWRRACRNVCAIQMKSTDRIGE